jgi:hypothetical protein
MGNDLTWFDILRPTYLMSLEYGGDAENEACGCADLMRGQGERNWSDIDRQPLTTNLFVNSENQL